jgi:hypothetical protein
MFAFSDKAPGAKRGRGRGGPGDDVVGPDLSPYFAAAGQAGAGIADFGKTAFGAWQAAGADADAKAKAEEEYRARYNDWLIEHNALLKDRQNIIDEMMLQDVSKIFGVPVEIDAHAEAIDALAQGYGVLSNAAGEAYEALVTGSGSATEAMKKALGQGLLAMGRDFFVRALGETAMGLAAVAIPGLGWNASQHFAAAAAYGGASLAAGVAANALGVGGSGASAGPRPSGGGRAMSVGGGINRGDTTRNVTVILGDGYDTSSSRVRHAMLARGIKRAMGSESSTTIRDG